jgi:hypothetical protein
VLDARCAVLRGLGFGADLFVAQPRSNRGRGTGPGESDKEAGERDGAISGLQRGRKVTM